MSGLEAVGSCINHLATEHSVVLPALTQVRGRERAEGESGSFICLSLLQGLTHSSTDIRIAACDVCGGLKKTPDPLLSALLPLLLGNTQEKNTAVRASAESSIVEIVADEEGLAVRACLTLRIFYG